VKSIACNEFHDALLDALGATSAARGLPPALAAHAESCAGCRAAHTELAASWRMFSELPPLAPPPAAHERTRAAVLELLRAEETAAQRRPLREAGRVALAVGSALLVAFATLFLLGGLIWGGALPDGHLFFCAAIFTGLLVGAFSLIYSATTVNGVHLDAAARVGVLSLAVTVAATFACPELHVLAWWDRSGVGAWLTGLLGAGASSLVFGFGYGLVPGFLGALFGGRLLAERPIANGLVAAGVVFVLAAPVLYLQSAPFAAGVVASWAAGTAAGTVCGVFGALRVRGRVAQAVG
jgi:hypothetical protein